MAQFKYLRTAVANQNLIQEEVQKILNWGNACLLPFNPESFVFWSAVKKRKN
jgi:hypothetical protein